MAEGLARHFKSEHANFYSAGIVAKGVDPKAIEIMKELNIDISDHHSKTLESLGGLLFDYVITLCGHADETCPVLPIKSKKIHVGFDDPPLLAKSSGTHEEALTHYRRVRDEIKDFILELDKFLPSSCQ